MLNKEKHHAILTSILKDIYSNKEISSLLGFKGGTAAYLFYGLPRYSVDLDFDLVEFSPVIEKNVFDQIYKIAQMHGKVDDFEIKNYTIFFELSYEVGQQKIKIEISRRLTASSYELKNYLGISMNVMKEADVFSNKLLALTQRKRSASRDLFDVHYFLKNNFLLNEGLIKEGSGKDLITYLVDCVEHIEGIADNNILHGLGELVDTKQKVWIKNNLKKDTIFLLQSKIDFIKRQI